MNLNILNTDIQAFIDAHIHTDLPKLLLKGISFESIDNKAIIQQIEAKKRCIKKLPSWFNTPEIYYPNTLNIEQSSSEITANYKSKLVSGESLMDITGGFGVDSYYFSQSIDRITYFEIDTELFNIVKHNFSVLGVKHITFSNKNGIDALKDLNHNYDWIYIDPSRRNSAKQKVFLLTDCVPNVISHQELLLRYASCVMIKTSPLLDITATLNSLKHIKALHIVAVGNEVKELLWILERNYEGALMVNTINITKTKPQCFNFKFSDESMALGSFSEPLKYLYEPNVAILKSGSFNGISDAYNVFKLHKHSHLYTSNTIVDFPGRSFKIEQQLAYNKSVFLKLGISKANVTTRNFPMSVSDIRKKMKLKDGGEHYIFFTTNLRNEKIILITKKI